MKKIRIFLINYVLAFLTFFPIWNLMWGNFWYYDYTESVQYYLSSFDQLKVLNPLMVFITFTMTVILALFYSLIGSYVSKVAWLCITAIVLNQLRLNYAYSYEQVTGGYQLALWSKYMLLLLAMPFSFWLIKKNQEKLIHFCHLALSIFILFVLGFTGYLFWAVTPLYFAKSPSLPINELKKNQKRLVWIIFDELDQRAVFEDKEGARNYPNFHKFKDSALYATRAYAPGAATIISLPALLLGKKLDKVKLLPHQQLLITAQNEENFKWSDQETVFSQAYKKGYRSAIKGFYHPYHRLFNDYLAEKKSFSLKIDLFDLRTLSAFILKKTFQLNFYFLEKLGSLAQSKTSSLASPKRHNHLKNFPLDQLEKTFKNFHQEVLRLTTKSDLNFIFIHCPYPHCPAYYSLKQDCFSCDDSADYFGNVKMTDHFFGEICQELKKQGLWDQTFLVVSSDHWFRESWTQLPFWYQVNHKEEDLAKQVDLRVPLLIKGINQKAGLVFEKSLNTVILHNLFLEMMDEKMSSAEDLKNWLEQHHNQVELEIPLKDFFIFNWD